MVALAHQVVENTSETEDVHLLRFMRILEHVVALIQDDLAGLPAHTSLDGLGMVRVLLSTELFGQSHVANFDLKQAIDQDIAGLDVPVDDVVVVKETDAFQGLAHHLL